MKRALVFGGSGFLGTFVVKELCEKNFEVLIASRNEDNFNLLKTFGFPGQITFKRFDASDVNSLSRFDFSKFDVVINLIGIGKEKGKNTYHAIHIDLPSHLAGFTKKVGIPFVHVSAFTGNENVKSKYVQSKRKGEEFVLQNNPESIIICPTVMIGEGGSLIQTFEKIINLTPFVPVIWGKIKMQPIFAGDVAKFIALLLQRPDMKGKTFDLSGVETILFKDFIQRICGFMNKRRTLIPVPIAAVSFGLKIKEFLPSFVFRTTVTSDILALSKENLIVVENHLPLLIKNPLKVDDVLSSVLSKYKLYD